MNAWGASEPAGLEPAAPLAFAAVGVHRMVLDGMAAWSTMVPDLELVADADSVAQLLDRPHAAAGTVVLGATTPDGDALLGDVLLLKSHGLRVVLLGGRHSGGERIDTSLEAAADGVVTLDQGLDILADLLRRIAPPAVPCVLRVPRVPDVSGVPGVPNLSEQERAVLLGYASGMTLSTVARQIGIRPSTAKEYLHRVKLKYRDVGRPTYTKIDLANRVREDGFSLDTAR